MKKFLASVGNAKLMARENGGLVHVADIRTLTESTLNFANTMEEVRAGQGAKLYGRFSHDSGLTVTLTDAMFDLNYIQRQIGAQVLDNPTAFYTQPVENWTFGTAISLERPAQAIGQACGLHSTFVWVRGVDCTKEEGIVVVPVNTTNNTITISQNEYGKIFEEGQKLCLQYFVSKPEARGLAINATFIPAELVLILTTKLFAGDAKAPETGRPVGEITIKIPRFQLDGTFDLSMAMSAAATMSLAGTALAVDDGTCDGDGIYAEIVEVIENSGVLDGATDAIVDSESKAIGAAPIVYLQYADGHVSKVTAAEGYIGTTYTDGSQDKALLDGSGEFTGNDGYIVVYDKQKYDTAVNTGVYSDITSIALADLIAGAAEKGITEATSFSTAATEIGKYYIYNGLVYKCKAVNTGAFTPANFDRVQNFIGTINGYVKEGKTGNMVATKVPFMAEAVDF